MCPPPRRDARRFDAPETSGRRLYAVSVLAFAATAVACIGTLTRARRIDHDGTRRGLVWLLVTSEGLATAHLPQVAVPGQSLQYLFYTVGLVVGRASVGPWLYFCSAYTGRPIDITNGMGRSARFEIRTGYPGVRGAGPTVYIPSRPTSN